MPSMNLENSDAKFFTRSKSTIFTKQFNRNIQDLSQTPQNMNHNNNNLITNYENNRIVHPGNLNNVINRTNPCEKVTDRPIKTFQEINHNILGEKDNNNKFNNYYENKKPIIKFNEYTKYNKKSQITHLPGGQKRNLLEIQDDKAEIQNSKKRNTEKSVQKKIESDYRSGISCLPSRAVIKIYIYLYYYINLNLILNTFNTFFIITSNLFTD